MSFKPDKKMIQQLEGMGFSKDLAKKALTHNRDLGDAVEWLVAYQAEDQPPARSSNVQRSVPPRGVDDLPPEIAAMQSYLQDTDFGDDFYKLVVVIDDELNMSMGKTSAAVANAAVGTYRCLVEQQYRFGDGLLQWDEYGETISIVKAKDTQHILDLKRKAEGIGCVQYLVKDEDKTEATPGSVRALGIFAKNNVVDSVIGDLPVMR